MVRSYNILYYDLQSEKMGDIDILATSISHAKDRFNNSYGSYRKIKDVKWIR